MMKRSQFARPSRKLLLCATVALAITGSALAQSAGTAKPAATDDDSGYAKWEVTPFAGWQWFQAFQGDNQRCSQCSRTPANGILGSVCCG